MISSGDQVDRDQSESPLRWLAPRVTTASEAVRWACLLEATSPKAGNVSPGVSFSDLCYIDFVKAANLASDSFAAHRTFGNAVFEAAKATSEACQSNVNLGILLLLGPLVAADNLLVDRVVNSPTPEDWLSAVSEVFSAMDQKDQQSIFRAIAVANAGGLGEVESWDVNQTHERVDLLAAMADAAGRGDRIALQYQTGFLDLFQEVIPVLLGAIQEAGDVLHGVMQSQLRILASSHDSLIMRKNGEAVAEEVRVAASGITNSDPMQYARFDRTLRAEAGNRLNPGTTADLIAAGLFVILRTMPEARAGDLEVG